MNRLLDAVRIYHRVNQRSISGENMVNVSLKVGLLVILVAILGSAQAPRGQQRPPRPGVKTPGVQTPISELKPDAVFEIPGTPDWIAIDEQVWVSNRPRNTVARLDPKTNSVVEHVTVG